MYNFARVSFVAVLALLSSGCERNAPSPVDIKISDIATGTHIVSGNETLFDIAYRYNIDPINLADINGIEAPYTLKNGQVLQLPNPDNKIQVKESGPAEGYVPVDQVNEAPFEEITEEDKKKQEEEIDSDFEAIILTSKEKSKKSADEDAKSLATPKVTATAVGGPKNGDKKDSSKKDKSSNKSSKMRMPVQGRVISHFGDINDGITNDGINIRANKGDAVVAAADGKVIYVGNKLDEEYGNVVIIQHDNGLITSYAHLDKASVKKDAEVTAGQKIGTVGQTGDVSEPQLYFEIMKNKKPVNPSKYLKK